MSLESKVGRHENLRKERKNFRQIAERMITRTSVTVNQQQNGELVKLVHSTELRREGQVGFAKVLEEADNHKPGTGAVTAKYVADGKGIISNQPGQEW